MKQITQEKFLELIEKDENMTKRLAEYLNGETDQKIVGQKVMEFAKKEGYEITLSDDDLANVSGGGIKDWFTPESLKRVLDKTEQIVKKGSDFIGTFVNKGSSKLGN